MGSQDEQDERIEALRALLERLSNPELTLAEAKDLRGSLNALLEPCDWPTGEDRTASLPVAVPNHEIGD
jgi:hypothetical protein